MPGTLCVDSCIPVVRNIGFVNLIVEFFVVIFDPRLLDPPPLWMTTPFEPRAAALPLAVVNSPEFVTVVAPPTVQAAFTVRLAPLKLKLPV